MRLGCGHAGCGEEIPSRAAPFLRAVQVRAGASSSSAANAPAYAASRPGLVITVARAVGLFGARTCAVLVMRRISECRMLSRSAWPKRSLSAASGRVDELVAQLREIDTRRQAAKARARSGG